MKVAVLVAVALVALAGAVGVARHFTSREIPSQIVAEAGVAHWYHLSSSTKVRCVRVRGGDMHYWDYSCTWTGSGGPQHDWFRFEGSRVVETDRMWG